MDYNNYYYQQPQGQPYYTGYDPNNAYGYQTMGFNNMQAPSNQNALTAEEIQALKNCRPQSTLSVSVDQNDVLRSICCHKENGRDVVIAVSDGSGNVYCPICNAIWQPEMMTEEEVKELVDKLIAQMQNAKWAGDLPTNLTRELFTLIPLLQQYPKIHKYAMDTFNKYYTSRGMIQGQDTTVYGMFNNLFGNGSPIGYGGMQMNGYYNQQQPPMYQQPQQQGYYNQQYVPNGMNANPNYNPMQAPMGNNMYGGVNPMAPNQQFVQQANTMMGGTVNGYNQQSPMCSPVYGTPNVNQQQTQQQNNNQGPVVTPQSDGTVKSKTQIEL